MTAAYRPHLDAMQVTYPQYLALLALWEFPGITMRELGEHLRLDYGTISPIIARLQARGLVDSVRSESDRRTVHLRATPAGQALQRRAQQMIEATMAGIGYPVETLVELRDRINELGARLEQVSTGPLPPMS
ncbi:MarR family winged helix-turn-helix transcriptional regulator [Nocardia inohanensis]|uniref:MarR family winged helix-turn-helix transcriptional regulator n=1 Tax=Nocardia inohanensis TaxID=209246 RepID=UPI003F75C849